MTEIQSRLADINARAAVALEGHRRLQLALGKAVTLILTISAFGLLSVWALSQADLQFHKQDLINQENIAWQK